MKTRTCYAVIGFLLLAGCASIGPGTIDRDRFDYTMAVAESWKSQMLLNNVKLCYSDTPVFLDIPSVINQYAIQGKINLGAGWQTGVGALDSQVLGVEGLYAERPTITYAPLSGDKFTRNLLTPIPPASHGRFAKISASSFCCQAVRAVLPARRRRIAGRGYHPGPGDNRIAQSEEQHGRPVR